VDKARTQVVLNQVLTVLNLVWVDLNQALDLKVVLSPEWVDLNQELSVDLVD
jgi:hypothetical protein